MVESITITVNGKYEQSKVYGQSTVGRFLDFIDISYQLRFYVGIIYMPHVFVHGRNYGKIHGQKDCPSILCIWSIIWI